MLSIENIHGIIDEQVALLVDAEPRDHARWDVIGTYVWPNAQVADSYAGEIAFLKDWISQRVAWLDANLPGDCP